MKHIVPRTLQPDLEPERYELFSAPAYDFPFGRRGFFKALGGGIVVASIAVGANAQESGGARGRGGRAMPQQVGAWLHIDAKGAVTVYTGKVEVGQNARTSLTQAVAEELGAPLTAIELVMGDTERTPYDAGTFGSMTTPQMLSQLRRVAAAARPLLPPGRWDEINFAELEKNQTIVKATAASGHPKPTSEWTVLGTSVKKVHGRDIVTGRHRYTSDVKLEGMLHGRVLRPDRFNASLVSLDAGGAEKLQGVTVVHDGDFVGVVAPTTSAAANAVSTLKAQWKADPQTSSQTLFTDLKKWDESTSRQQSDASRDKEIDKALGEAAHKLELLTRSPTSPMHLWSRERRSPNGMEISSPFGPAHNGRSEYRANWHRRFTFPKRTSVC